MLSNGTDLLPIVTSTCSVLISLAATVFAMRSWHRTNRPVISARITTAEGGNNGIALNIVVENTGNRPAKAIKLIAERTAVLRAMKEPSSQEVPVDARHCFFEHKIIPVLANGKAASNALEHLAMMVTGKREPRSSYALST